MYANLEGKTVCHCKIEYDTLLLIHVLIIAICDYNHELQQQSSSHRWQSHSDIFRRWKTPKELSNIMLLMELWTYSNNSDDFFAVTRHFIGKYVNIAEACKRTGHFRTYRLHRHNWLLVVTAAHQILCQRGLFHLTKVKMVWGHRYFHQMFPTSFSWSFSFYACLAMK